MDAVVAQDGSGHHTSVQAAVDAAPSNLLHGRYIIYIKKGVYKEIVRVNEVKQRMMMIGDGIGMTVITGSRNNVDGYFTFNSSTFGKLPTQL